MNGLADTLAKSAFSTGKQSRHVFVLSAKDETTARKMVENFRKYLQSSASIWKLSDLSHTLTRRRSDFQWRVAASAQTLDELAGAFADPRLSPVLALQPPRLGFVFTGQGAQWFAMGRELMTSYPRFLASLQEADSCLRELGASWSLIGECLSEHVGFAIDRKQSR